MIIDNKNKTGYILHTFETGKTALCRILNEYGNSEEAQKDLVELLGNNVSEEDILDKYSKKDIF